MRSRETMATMKGKARQEDDRAGKERQGMKLLFIDACMREPEVSRTHGLCQAFLEELKKSAPEIQVETCCLRTAGLQPYDGAQVIRREALIDAGRLDAAEFAAARAFNQADFLLIGAPYWDLSFPAALKIYVENIFVRNLNFRYTRAGEPIGLAHGKKAVYITTAGSPIGGNDWGAGYIKAVLKMLGVQGFTRISAEGIDIQGFDQAAILARGEAAAREAARGLLTDPT